MKQANVKTFSKNYHQKDYKTLWILMIMKNYKNSLIMKYKNWQIWNEV